VSCIPIENLCIEFCSPEFAENGSIYDYIHMKCKKPSLAQEGLPWLKQVAEGIVML